MSQIYKSSASGPPPPAVPTDFVTQDGTAVPALNILLVNGFDSSENNNNGIITKGGVAGTGTANEMDIVLTNRLQGTATTVDAVTADVMTFALGATPGVYTVEFRVSGFDTTSSLGCGYSMFGTIRTTGAAAVLIDPADRINHEEGILGTVPSVNAVYVASGNNLILRVTGKAGETINWGAVGLYTFVG